MGIGRTLVGLGVVIALFIAVWTWRDAVRNNRPIVRADVNVQGTVGLGVPGGQGGPGQPVPVTSFPQGTATIGGQTLRGYLVPGWATALIPAGYTVITDGELIVFDTHVEDVNVNTVAVAETIGETRAYSPTGMVVLNARVRGQVCTDLANANRANSAMPVCQPGLMQLGR